MIETYLEATERETRLRQAAEEAAAERSRALAELHRSGMSYGKISEATGLSRSRVQQLVERYRVTEDLTTRKPPSLLEKPFPG